MTPDRSRADGAVPGALCLVLHSHLPWLQHHGVWPLGEEWLHQAWVESYVPLVAELTRSRPRATATSSRSASPRCWPPSSTTRTPSSRRAPGRPCGSCAAVSWASQPATGRRASRATSTPRPPRRRRPWRRAGAPAVPGPALAGRRRRGPAARRPGDAPVPAAAAPRDGRRRPAGRPRGQPVAARLAARGHLVARVRLPPRAWAGTWPRPGVTTSSSTSRPSPTAAARPPPGGRSTARTSWRCRATWRSPT